VIEENIFDHNAWNDTAGVAASIFNHHLYLYDLTDGYVRKNLFLRCESLSVKSVSSGLGMASNVNVDDNLFFEGEYGIGATFQSRTTGSTNNTPSGGSCGVGLTVTNNVFTQTDRQNPTGRTLGWGIVVSSLADATFSRNIFSDYSHVSSNKAAITLESDGQASSTSTNVVIENNILYKIGYQNIVAMPQAAWSGIVIRNNSIQDAGLGAQMHAITGTFAPLSFSGNTYSASNSSNFAYFSGAAKTYAQWLTTSGETGSTQQTVTYPDPGRTLDSYVATINGAWTLTDFYAAIKTQSRFNWHSEYLGSTVNNYFRAGFGTSVGADAGSDAPTGTGTGTSTGTGTTSQTQTSSSSSTSTSTSVIAAPGVWWRRIIFW
jgi:hypothetical protein